MEDAPNPGGRATRGDANGGGSGGGKACGGGVFDDLDELWPARLSAAVAMLAQIGVGNPATSSHWTSRLAGVE
jgi:hypothetical protein